ncbi:hypothetical protein SAMN05421666_1268 [Roseovarius nanhaiticus]|uniref:Cytochrome c domain-containing protein n=1 Tax=Roseovarius nanhaiticus TaxID=573024 RepID=A0A1N7FQL0_9RHOB|nr:hypothetical protein SAMN05216208_0868 [Roseovarius nanhaiticus]SIS02535.1 hypothetical protein SAMN05421666_1268 [Roseovarius nanhaiticus]
MRSGLATLAAGLTFAAGIAGADPAHDLFTGQNTTAADGRIARFACHKCHGRDGTGGIEGNVPEIAGSALLKPTELRSAYTLEQFRDALTSGTNPDGRSLSRIMPRYDLSGAELKSLWRYLKDLPNQQAKGIAPDNVRFGVVSDPAFPALSARYLYAFKNEVARLLPSGAVYGRKIEVVALDDPLGQADMVIAALAMPPHQDDLTDQLVATGLPVIFALNAIGGREDASIQRSFLPTERDIDGAIAAHLATTTAQRIGISAEPDRVETLSFLIRLAVPEAVVGPVDHFVANQQKPDAVIDLAGHVPAELPDPVILYRLASKAHATPHAERSFLIIEAPHLIELALDEDLHPLEAHATLSARVLAKLLRQAGRDLSRSRLLSALKDTSLGPENLDYARLPLNGSNDVAIVEYLHPEN